MTAPYPPPGPYYPPGYVPPARRPIGVAILSILVILVGVVLFIGAIALLVFTVAVGLAGFKLFGLVGAVLGGVLLILSLIWLGVGLGLWHLRSWAWWLAVIVMVISIVGSFAAPFGAVIPAIILVYLIIVRDHFH